MAALLPFLSTLLGVGVGQDIQSFDLMPWDIEYYDMDGMYSELMLYMRTHASLCRF